jgi:hypothetical protein
VCRPFVWLHHGGAGLYPNAFGLKILKVSWIFPSNPSLGSSFAIAALGLDERSVGGDPLPLLSFWSLPQNRFRVARWLTHFSLP